MGTSTHSFIGRPWLDGSKSRAPDFREFRLYRGASPAFVPGAPNLVLATSDTGYVDAAGDFSYKLAAVDVHGNTSRYSVVTPILPVATLVTILVSDRTANITGINYVIDGGLIKTT